MAVYCPIQQFISIRENQNLSIDRNEGVLEAQTCVCKLSVKYWKDV